MAVFRIEKNSDFTIMPNYPFRDMRLSFKGRGLLGTMLTLRDDWDYTLAGLTAISPHGKSYVSTGLNELEQLGYLERRQLRDEQGRFIDTEYVIYEVPRSIQPSEETPEPENPETDAPTAENPPQLNTRYNQGLKNKELIGLYVLSEDYARFGFLPFSQQELASAIGASRVQVARVCEKLKAQGIVDIKKRRLYVLDRAALAEMASLEVSS